MSVSIAHETSDVNRPPELDTVLEQLRRQFDAPNLALDGSPVRLNGGFWAEMWTLTLAAHSTLPARVVLRLAPDSQLAAWETTLQAASPHRATRHQPSARRTSRRRATGGPGA